MAAAVPTGRACVRGLSFPGLSGILFVLYFSQTHLLAQSLLRLWDMKYDCNPMPQGLGLQRHETK